MNYTSAAALAFELRGSETLDPDALLARLHRLLPHLDAEQVRALTEHLLSGALPTQLDQRLLASGAPDTARPAWRV